MGVVRMYRCVVVWRYIYINFHILFIPSPLVLALFCSSIPTSLFIKKNVFRSLIKIIQSAEAHMYNYNNNYYYTYVKLLNIKHMR